MLTFCISTWPTGDVIWEYNRRRASENKISLRLVSCLFCAPRSPWRARLALRRDALPGPSPTARTRAPRPAGGHGTVVPTVVPGASHAETPPARRMFPRPRPRPRGTRYVVLRPCPAPRLAARWRARLRRAHGRAGCTAREDAARREDASPSRAPEGRAPRFTRPRLPPPAGGHGSGGPTVVPGAPHAETPPARRMFPRPPAPRRDALPGSPPAPRPPAPQRDALPARASRRPLEGTAPAGPRSCRVHRTQRHRPPGGCFPDPARAPAGRTTPRTSPARAPAGRAPRFTRPRLPPPAGGHGSGVPTVVPGTPHAETPPVVRIPLRPHRPAPRRDALRRLAPVPRPAPAPPAGGHGSGVPTVVPGASHAETPPVVRIPLRPPAPPAPRRDALPLHLTFPTFCSQSLKKPPSLPRHECRADPSRVTR